MAGPENVDEQAVTDHIGLVTRLVLQGIVENEEFVVAPAMDLVANLNICTRIADVV